MDRRRYVSAETFSAADVHVGSQILWGGRLAVLPERWWHPLVSGDPESVHAAGISARGRTVSEDDVPVEDFEDYLVDWPLTVGEQR